METMRDLGVLDGPVLLFGGPCSNLRATQALIAVARERGIPAARMICTGDVCAYAAEPEETAQAIIALGCPVVAGNCERAVGGNLPGCNCNFEDGGTCDLLSKQWFDFAKRETSDAAKAWMLATPDSIIFTHAGQRYAAIHGGASNVSTYVWPTDPAKKLEAELALLEEKTGPVDAVIAGHSGIPFEKMLPGGQRWINAGAIGITPHDGDPRTSYAVLEEGRVTLHRLDYDHEGTARAMEEAGLTGGYHETMRVGWWPSEDTLPPAMRLGRTAMEAQSA